MQTAHSATTPVYSPTLEEWRLHAGIDIVTEEGAPVFAAAGGVVSAVYVHPLLGQTVEITHKDNVKSVYRNLSPDGIVALGKTVISGERIGTVGDSAIA